MIWYMAVSVESRKLIKLGENMYIEVIKERYNSLVKRVELTCIINHIGVGTPSRREIREILSKEYNKPIENIYIREIKTMWGVGRSLVRVNIYDDAERASLFEPEYIIKRDST